MDTNYTNKPSLAQPHDDLLRNALRANGVFSTLSGLVMTAFPTTVADWLGIETAWPVRLIGIGLLLFAAGLFYDASRPALNRLKAMVTIGQDMLWVVGSVVLIALNPFDFSQDGLVLVGIIAAVVLAFAIIQEIGVQRLTSSQD